MPTAFSLDLRVRVLAALAKGLSHRAAAERFGASAASVSRWRRLAYDLGEARARSMGGDRRSDRIEAHKDMILTVLETTPDIAIEELRQTLAGKGVIVGYGTIRRFFVQHGDRVFRDRHFCTGLAHSFRLALSAQSSANADGSENVHLGITRGIRRPRVSADEVRANVGVN